jgi:hypothetical protein
VPRPPVVGGGGCRLRPAGPGAVAGRRRAGVKLFSTGRVRAAPGVIEAVERMDGPGLHVVVLACLLRHVFGDWGEVPPEDRATHDHALVTGDRLLSAYTLRGGTKVWVITEADRSATTLLLPEEY